MRWAAIQNYEDLYKINDEGQVWSFRRNKYLKPGMSSNGYLTVALCRNDEGKTFTIHKLVAHSFLVKPEYKAEINHKNGIKTDNRLDNLEFVTRLANIYHANTTGLRNLQKVGLPRRPVVHLKTGIVYENVYHAGRELGLRPSSIRQGIFSSISKKYPFAYDPSGTY